MKPALMLAFLALIFFPGLAQGKTELTGYYKNLLLRNGDQLVTGNRLRLKYLVDFSPHINAEIQYTNQFTFGQFSQFQLPLNQLNFIHSDRVLLRETGLDWTHSFYRAFVSFQINNLDVIIGRQRIAWGTGRFWNPTDLLNPFDPTNIEGSERTGVDALNIRVNTGLLSFLSLVAAPGSSLNQSSLATRYHTTIGPHDLSLMTGKFKNNLVIGGDFSGSFKGAGVRLESSYTLSPQKNFWKGVVSVDYSLPRTYLLGEYFYNGQGEANKQKYDYLSQRNGTLNNLGQHYLGGTLTYELHPLMQGATQILINLNDGSLLWGPSLAYSISSNTDLVFGLNWFMGLEDTEFGRQPVLLFSQLQWNF